MSRIRVNDNANHPQMDRRYRFDAVGNLTEKLTRQGKFTYQYDQANGFGKQQYSYDANGNRLSHTHTAAGVTRQTGYNYDAHQALTTLTQTVGDVTTVLNYLYDNNWASPGGQTPWPGTTTTRMADG